MTEKKESIIKAALKLFAEEGYGATSTNKVAKEAGVSEGLIFRHFENKEGLLKAILADGQERVKELFTEIIFQTDPKLVIRKALEMPFKISDNDHEFWRLQFKLKWELKNYASHKMEPLELSLANAFKNLDYANPEKETQLLIHLIEGMASAILKNALPKKEEFLKFLFQKYNL